MNGIDIIILINILTFVTLLFFVYRWYKTLLVSYGKIVALLLPIAFIGFLSSFNTITESEAKKISEDAVSQAFENEKISKNDATIKSIVFDEDVSLFQQLMFVYKVKFDTSGYQYRIVQDVNMSASGLNGNLKWKNHRTDLRKINDSIYEFKIDVSYTTQIAHILTYSGQKEIVKRINIKEYINR